ncbi:hypothetical protein JHK87_016242 [Glycine soja]|nr:hypothetical protein JHK87_016242 [Glycine soja]
MTDSHKLDTILEEAFNAKIPIQLPPVPPPIPRQIKEQIQAGYLAQFVKKPDNNPAGARPRGHQDDHHRSQDEDRRRDKTKERSRQRRNQQRRKCQPQHKQENEPIQQIKGIINTIVGEFSYEGLCSQSRKRHLHAIQDIDVNCINIQSPRSLPPITFTDKDFKGINPINQDGPMVIFIVIANFMVSKVLIN